MNINNFSFNTYPALKPKFGAINYSDLELGQTVRTNTELYKASEVEGVHYTSGEPLGAPSTKTIPQGTSFTVAAFYDQGSRGTEVSLENSDGVTKAGVLTQISLNTKFKNESGEFVFNELDPVD